MKVQATPIPLIALVCVGLSYAYLGWQMSAYYWLWSVSAWLFAILLLVTLMQGGVWVGRMLQLGPRGVVSMLVLSTVVTLAVLAYKLFAVLLIMLASQLLARLELQAVGFSRGYTLWLLLVVATTTFVSGWGFGKTIYPATQLWLS
jgi:hypothetical protein